MNPNSMTTLASTNGRKSMSTAGRPPVVAWTLRILLCTTDARTAQGEVTRMLDRAHEELTVEECAVVVETVKACLGEIRRGSQLLAELHPSQRSSS